jgi:hypothetical protein
MNKLSVIVAATFVAASVFYSEAVSAAKSVEMNTGLEAQQLEPDPLRVDEKRNGGGVFNWWRHERERRQAEVDRYLADNGANFDSFRTAPLAIRQDPLNFVSCPWEPAIFSPRVSRRPSATPDPSRSIMRPSPV